MTALHPYVNINIMTNLHSGPAGSHQPPSEDDQKMAMTKKKQKLFLIIGGQFADYVSLNVNLTVIPLHEQIIILA